MGVKKSVNKKFKLSDEQVVVLQEVVAERFSYDGFLSALEIAARTLGYSNYYMFPAAYPLHSSSRPSSRSFVSPRAALLYLEVLENDPRLDFLRPSADSVRK